MWLTPVLKAYNDYSWLRVQTQGLAIKNPFINKFNKNHVIFRSYTWPDWMSKPTLVRGSDDWCFYRRDKTTISSLTINNVQYTSGTYGFHTL